MLQKAAAVFFSLLVSAACHAASGKAALPGTWVYASGESGGRSSAVYGQLKIEKNGKFEDNRRIGGIGGFRKGSWSATNDKLTLKFDDGKNTQTYGYSFGTRKDKKGGKDLETLLLRGNDLSFLLTRKAEQ